MKTCLYYWMLEPVRPQFKDNHESKPAWEVEIQHVQGTATFALFTDDAGLPIHARLTLPCLEREELPSEHLPLIQALREHLLSVLRLTFRQDALLFPHPVWMFVDDPKSFSVGLDLAIEYGGQSFPAEAARNLFVASFTQREAVRLFIDGNDSNIPLQYRFLSLYRLLELVYRQRGRWRSAELAQALSAFAPRFKEAGFQQKPLGLLHSLRDSCAHIRTTRGRLGVTHLNHREAARVQACLPVLLDFCARLVSERSEGQFRLGHHANVNGLTAWSSGQGGIAGRSP